MWGAPAPLPPPPRPPGLFPQVHEGGVSSILASSKKTHGLVPPRSFARSSRQRWRRCRMSRGVSFSHFPRARDFKSSSAKTRPPMCREMPASRLSAKAVSTGFQRTLLLKERCASTRCWVLPICPLFPQTLSLSGGNAKDVGDLTCAKAFVKHP